MSGGTPFCCYCRWYLPGFQSRRESCHRIVREETNVVTGPRYLHGSFNPYSERATERTLLGREKCGPSGRFFEKMPSPPPPSRK